MSYSKATVIGSGAGGSLVFKTLTENGIDTVLFEEGPKLTDFSSKTISEVTSELYRNKGAVPIFGRPIITFAEGCVLGGTTEINGGLFWRTPEWVLDEWVSLGILDSTSELEKHFEILEKRLGVKIHNYPEGTNSDSEMLALGARIIGGKVIAAPRALVDCKMANRCGSGCPSGAKQSMSRTLIPDGQKAGGIVHSSSRVIRLNRKQSKISSVTLVDGVTGKKYKHYSDSFFLCAGSLQTPKLLRKSGLYPKLLKTNLGLHLNLKVIAEFDEEINASEATMFTWQYQEHMREGRIAMATNLSPQYLSIATAGWPVQRVSELMEKINHLGLYTVQIRPNNYGKLFTLGNFQIPIYLSDDNTKQSTIRGLKELTEILFQAGAKSISYPLRKHNITHSHAEAVTLLSKIKFSDLQISSVHAMASFPSRNESRKGITKFGKVRGVDNLYVQDASILPTTIGESPQATIMALVRRNLEVIIPDLEINSAQSTDES